MNEPDQHEPLRYDVRVLNSGGVAVLQWSPNCGSPLYGVRVTALGGSRVEFRCRSENAAQVLAAAHREFVDDWDDWPDIVNPPPRSIGL